MGRARARTARRQTPIPIPTFDPLLRLVEAGMEEACDEVGEAGMEEAFDEVGDGTAVFRGMVVVAAVALAVTAIVYPAAE